MAGTVDSTKEKKAAPTEALPLHVVDLGRAKRKQVSALKKGRGDLIDDVAEALSEIEASLGDDAAGKAILPVVVIVEKKQKRKRGLLPRL